MASHPCDEIHFIRFTIPELQRHLRNRLHSGHSMHGDSQRIGKMTKSELEKLHKELHCDR